MSLKSPTVLAFDLGASSGRALIGEMISGTNGEKSLRMTEIHRFTNGHIQVGKHYYWDILMIVQEIKKGIRKAFQQGFLPVSYGIDTWGVDFGLLDHNGELLGNPYHYRDPQTNGLINEICEMVGEERLFKEGGLQLLPFNTIYQLYAMKKSNCSKLTHAKTLLLTPDLLNYFLTGEKTCEFTMATTTQLFLPNQGVWNEPLMKELGIPSSLFIEPIQPGAIIGNITDEVRKELGVPDLKAIAVGSHDTESAIVAVPANTSNFVYLVCGTWSLLGTELEEALLTMEVRQLQFSNEGGVGHTYQLLKNIMGLWILQECKRKWDRIDTEVTFTEIVREAAEVTPFRSLIDPDDLRFLNPSDMEKEIQNFCEETEQPVPRQRGEVVRCILESLALRYRKVLEQIEKLTGHSYAGLHMIGGGIQNELLCQFTANAIARPVWAGPVEASAIGNIIVQFHAIGEFNDVKEATSIIKRSFPVVTYEPSTTEDWSDAYHQYDQISHSI